MNVWPRLASGPSVGETLADALNFTGQNRGNCGTMQVGNDVAYAHGMIDEPRNGSTKHFILKPKESRKKHE